MVFFNDVAYDVSRLLPNTEEQRKHISRQEIEDSGIMDVISDVADNIRWKQVQICSGLKVREYGYERRIFRDMVSCVMDAMVASAVNDPEILDDEQILEYLAQYVCGPVNDFSYIFTSVSMPMRNLSVIVSRGNIAILSPADHNILYRTCSGVNHMHLRSVLLMDAAMDGLCIAFEALMLEIEAVCKSQEIYQTMAIRVAEHLVSEYQGMTRISQKGNRITVHYYLSDRDKAFITFFKDKCPWVLPDPPTDSVSLRELSNSEDSPFCITSLSKADIKFINECGHVVCSKT